MTLQVILYLNSVDAVQVWMGSRCVIFCALAFYWPLTHCLVLCQQARYLLGPLFVCVVYPNSCYLNRHRHIFAVKGIWWHSLKKKDESFFPELSRGWAFMEKDRVCALGSLVVWAFSLQLPPSPEMWNNPRFYVLACAGEKGRHYLGGTLLASWHGSGAQSVLHLYTSPHTMHQVSCF